MNAQVDKYLAPFRELNALAVENAEKVIDMQMKYIEENAKIGLESMKEAAAITDVEGLKAYMTKQAEVSKTLAERTMADGRSMVELGNSYTAELQKIMKDAIAV